MQFVPLPHYAARGSIDYAAIRSKIGSNDPSSALAQRAASSPAGNIVAGRMVIRLLRPINPKTGKSALRYGCYQDAMTVDDYESTVAVQLGRTEAGKCRADIRWDLERGFIRLEQRR